MRRLAHGEIFYGWRVVAAAFGLLRTESASTAAPELFAAALALQALAALAFLAGRQRVRRQLAASPPPLA